MKIYNFLYKMSDALDFGSQETHDTITMTSSWWVYWNSAWVQDAGTHRQGLGNTPWK